MGITWVYRVLLHTSRTKLVNRVREKEGRRRGEEKGKEEEGRVKKEEGRGNER